MSTRHIVEQGEYLALIARRYRFADWRLIYDHPDNEAFRAKRPDPDVIFPGDVIAIPEKETKSVYLPTGAQHKFRVRRGPPAELKIVLKDTRGRAMANEPYCLRIGAEEHRGTTGGDGRITVPLRIGDQKGTLTLDNHPWIEWQVNVGALDPAHDADREHPVVTGVQARLNNLGFPCGPVDGKLGPRTRAALRAFQRVIMQRQDADGQPDQATCERLVTEHGA